MFKSPFFVIVPASALALSAFVHSPSAQAQENDETLAQFGAQLLGAVTIEGSDRYSLESSYTEQVYLIDVLRVESLSAPPSADQQLPVVYVLDGNGFFPIVAQSADWLALITNEMPSALIVSIGYMSDATRNRTENLMTRLNIRTRDLTPTVVDVGSPDDEAPTLSGGGANDLLAFINGNLKPFIAAQYTIDPEDQTLVGHSLAGLFTLYTLFSAPETFNRYVASSPSLWWDERVSYQIEADFAESGRDLSARLFISVGSLESESMISDAAAMAARLRARVSEGVYPNLTLTSHVFEGEHHTSVIPGAMMRGLRDVFR